MLPHTSTTSPHLHRFVERFRVGGAPVGDDLAAELADAIMDEMARAAEPKALAKVRGGTACASPEEALARAQAACAEGEAVVVCGSIYFVARVRAALLGLAQEPPVGL